MERNVFILEIYNCKNVYLLCCFIEFFFVIHDWSLTAIDLYIAARVHEQQKEMQNDTRHILHKKEKSEKIFCLITEPKILLLIGPFSLTAVTSVLSLLPPLLLKEWLKHLSYLIKNNDTYIHTIPGIM